MILKCQLRTNDSGPSAPPNRGLSRLIFSTLSVSPHAVSYTHLAGLRFQAVPHVVFGADSAVQLDRLCNWSTFACIGNSLYRYSGGEKLPISADSLQQTCFFAVADPPSRPSGQHLVFNSGEVKGRNIAGIGTCLLYTSRCV